MWPWQFYLPGDDTQGPSIVTLGFEPSLYMTLAGSLGLGDKCRDEAWRHLIAGVEAIRSANARGELTEGEWGNTSLRAPDADR